MHRLVDAAAIADHQRAHFRCRRITKVAIDETRDVGSHLLNVAARKRPMLREDFDLGTPVALHREHRRIDPFAFHEAFVVELSWIAEVAGETNSALKPHSVAEPKRAWMKRGQANNPSRGMRGSPLLGCDIDRNIQTHL